MKKFHKIKTLIGAKRYLKKIKLTPMYPTSENQVIRVANWFKAHEIKLDV